MIQAPHLFPRNLTKISHVLSQIFSLNESIFRSTVKKATAHYSGAALRGTQTLSERDVHVCVCGGGGGVTLGG